MGNMIIYAGIGSRDTPKEFLKYFTEIGSCFGGCGYILRSGGADGCDLAFEKGCDMRHGKKEIYLPWSGFNNSTSKLVVNNIRAFDIAKKYHPYWEKLSQGAKKLQARNSHQILGLDLKTPCDFVLCWTKDGKLKGGTSQALRIALDYNIPIFNFGNYDTVKDCYGDFRIFLDKWVNKIN